ncbi:Holliday junction resolvase RuvX [Gemmata obscuriglobus]|uniref:Holliday junction resolvase RuvX n=1 Tax=Gemmata obscuriglobus TaxID=114 RepID=UPI0012F8E26D|nr:Holliday junction resolvase RuvX [Gemmata obscuriglobus]
MSGPAELSLPSVGGAGRGGPSFPPRGALLGVDYGTKRIGVAVCDPDRVIASPVGTQANDATREPYFRDLCARSKFAGVVVGLPLHASGEESPMSGEARAFARWLSDLTGLPVVMWDERHTSFAAESALLGAGLTRKKRKEKVDRVAAQMILQTFIDAGSPPNGSDVPPAGPDSASEPDAN